jgi:ABC-type lipoprotein release transport system permease subunit
MLHGISSVDPPTLGASASILFGAVLAASALPAWRASRVDPAVTLREE